MTDLIQRFQGGIKLIRHRIDGRTMTNPEIRIRRL